MDINMGATRSIQKIAILWIITGKLRWTLKRVAFI